MFGHDTDTSSMTDSCNDEDKTVEIVHAYGMQQSDLGLRSVKLVIDLRLIAS
jgi:hypothetical protein